MKRTCTFLRKILMLMVALFISSCSAPLHSTPDIHPLREGTYQTCDPLSDNTSFSSIKVTFKSISEEEYKTANGVNVIKEHSSYYKGKKYFVFELMFFLKDANSYVRARVTNVKMFAKGLFYTGKISVIYNEKTYVSSEYDTYLFHPDSYLPTQELEYYTDETIMIFNQYTLYYQHHRNSIEEGTFYGEKYVGENKYQYTLNISEYEVNSSNCFLEDCSYYGYQRKKYEINLSLKKNEKDEYFKYSREKFHYSAKEDHYENQIIIKENIINVYIQVHSSLEKFKYSLIFEINEIKEIYVIDIQKI